MTNSQEIILIVAVAGVISVAAWIGLIATPAVRSYWGIWPRVAALLASVYVFVAVLAVGAAVGAGVLLMYGEL